MKGKEHTKLCKLYYTCDSLTYIQTNLEMIIISLYIVYGSYLYLMVTIFFCDCGLKHSLHNYAIMWIIW